MTRRRNSPALAQMSPYMRRLVDERVHAIASIAPQAEMPGMETSEAAAMLVNDRRRREKPSQKRKAEDDFAFDCRRFKLPAFVRQWELLKSEQTPRKDLKPIPKVWRFDFCFVEWKIIVEIDGGIFMVGGGAHSHPVDVKRNLFKRNDAGRAGFTVFSFMPEHVKSGYAVAYVQQVLYARGWKPS